MGISFDYTFFVVLFGTSLLGLVSGALGSFAVLRKQSLLGDAISHAALPGIGIAFLITLTKSPLFLLLGAIGAGWLGTILMLLIIKNTLIKEDAALGIILSVFFGFGMVLLTIIQKIPTANQSGLTAYLFGSASTLLIEDLKIMFVLGSLTLALLILFWKEFKLLTFDSDYAISLGFPVKKIEVLLTTLIVVAIVIGLQTVGVVLMSAMVIAPAAAARQWTDRLSVMVVLSSLFGALGGSSGALLSSMIPNLPTGPTIVLMISFFVIVSLLFAPNRGLVWGWIRSRKSRSNIHESSMLTNLLLFSESATNPTYPHDISALTAIGRGPAVKALNKLLRKGLAYNPEGNKWALTPQGVEAARSLKASMEKLSDEY